MNLKVGCWFFFVIFIVVVVVVVVVETLQTFKNLPTRQLVCHIIVRIQVFLVNLLRR
jgi:hypothetical protein